MTDEQLQQVIPYTLAFLLNGPYPKCPLSDTAFHLSVFVGPCSSTFTSLLAPPWNTTLLYLPQYLAWGIATNNWVEILVPSVTSLWPLCSILGWKISHTHFDDGVALTVRIWIRANITQIFKDLHIVSSVLVSLLRTTLLPHICSSQQNVGSLTKPLSTHPGAFVYFPGDRDCHGAGQEAAADAPRPAWEETHQWCAVCGQDAGRHGHSQIHLHRHHLQHPAQGRRMFPLCFFQVSLRASC